MVSGSENSCPNVRSSHGSTRQVSSLELVFPNLLCKLNAADGYLTNSADTLRGTETCSRATWMVYL
jgi:hypothetical protein